MAKRNVSLLEYFVIYYRPPTYFGCRCHYCRQGHSDKGRRWALPNFALTAVSTRFSIQAFCFHHNIGPTSDISLRQLSNDYSSLPPPKGLTAQALLS